MNDLLLGFFVEKIIPWSKSIHISPDDIGSATSLYITSLGVIVFLFIFIYNDAKYNNHRKKFLGVFVFWILASIISLSAIFVIGNQARLGLQLGGFVLYLIGVVNIFILFRSIHTLNMFPRSRFRKIDQFKLERFLTSIKEVDEIIDTDSNEGFMLNNTILLRARNNTHPWIFWEKVSRHLIEQNKFKMIYICINRPKEVIIDEFDWPEIDKYIESSIFFIDGFNNIINNNDSSKNGKFNPYNIHTLIYQFERNILPKIGNEKYVIVLDSLSFLYKFSGEENGLKFIYYLIQLTTTSNVLNLLYYRDGLLNKEIEVAIENSVDSIIDFHESTSPGTEKLVFTKFRKTKLKKREVCYSL